MMMYDSPKQDVDSTIKKDTSLSADILSALGVILVVLGMICLRAYVFVKLWDWYISPVFRMEHLTMPFAFGISVLVAHLVPANHHDSMDKKQAMYVLMRPLLALGLGWLGTLFI